jgi:Spy/CpxP family protein refolding chaperone
MFHKLKSIVVLVPVLIWIFAPVNSLGARIPPGKWWRVPRVSEQLSLNDREKKELDALFVQSRRSLIDLKSTLEKERFELGILMEKETLDEDAIMVQFKKLERARANLAAERFHFFLEVRKILGSERFQSLRMLFKEFREKRLERQSRLGKP